MFTQQTTVVSDTTPRRTNATGGVAPLIPLIKDSHGEAAVSARTLHMFLQARRDFTTWCKQMFEDDFKEGADYQIIYVTKKGDIDNEAVNLPPIRRTQLGISTDYVLTLDCGKEIAMLQRSEKGREARQYFIDVEKAYRQQQATTYADQALPREVYRVLNLLVEEIKQLREDNSNLSRKIDLLKRDNGKALKQIRLNRIDRKAQVDQQKREDDRARQRIALFDLFAEYTKIETITSAPMLMLEVVNKVKQYYCFNLDEQNRYQGEHLFDVAIRHGKGHCVEGVIRCHMHFSRDLK